jgi:hypothetical protein
MATPPPGDPTRTDLKPADMTWTVVADEAATMTAVMLDADVPSWGIVWREADRQGNLSVPRCQALRISNGELRCHCCCCYLITVALYYVRKCVFCCACGSQVVSIFGAVSAEAAAPKPSRVIHVGTAELLVCFPCLPLTLVDAVQELE